MTKKEATTFERFSAVNAAILESVCPSCEPYKDWFTYKRWEAQGKQVAKGQHGTRITVVVNKDDDDDDEQTVKYAKVWHAVVFCRHQVE
jgi:antirestriction protein ArdC